MWSQTSKTFQVNYIYLSLGKTEKLQSSLGRVTGKVSGIHSSIEPIIRDYDVFTKLLEDTYSFGICIDKILNYCNSNRFDISNAPLNCLKRNKLWTLLIILS